jgi:hypothetical protein
MAAAITRLCNQTLGVKNHSALTITAMAILAIRGNQSIDIMKILQQYKKANITLKTVLNAEIGIEKSTIPSKTTTAKK